MPRKEIGVGKTEGGNQEGQRSSRRQQSEFKPVRGKDARSGRRSAVQVWTGSV